MKTHPESIWVEEIAIVRARFYCSSLSRVYVDSHGLGGMYSEFVPAFALTGLTARLEKAEFSANGFESLYDSAHKENESLKVQLQTQTETMLALWVFVERIANDSGRHTALDIAQSELYSLIHEAQDLLLKVTR